MLVYVIINNIFPENIVFQKYPIIVVILIFSPCAVYLITLLLFSFKHLLKNKSKLVDLDINEVTNLTESLEQTKELIIETKPKHVIKKIHPHDIKKKHHHDI